MYPEKRYYLLERSPSHLHQVGSRLVVLVLQIFHPLRLISFHIAEAESETASLNMTFILLPYGPGPIGVKLSISPGLISFQFRRAQAKLTYIASEREIRVRAVVAGLGELGARI